MKKHEVRTLRNARVKALYVLRNVKVIRVDEMASSLA